MSENKTQNYLVIVVVGLLGFTAINFAGDFMFRGGQMELNEGMVNNWKTMSNINGNNDKTHYLVTDILTQLDEDVRNNMKVIDRLIGIILRDDF